MFSYIGLFLFTYDGHIWRPGFIVCSFLAIGEIHLVLDYGANLNSFKFSFKENLQLSIISHLQVYAGLSILTTKF